MSRSVIIDRDAGPYLAVWKENAASDSTRDRPSLREDIARAKLDYPHHFPCVPLESWYRTEKHGFEKHAIVLNRFLGGLEKKMILDIGCGPAGLPTRVARAGALGFGIDTYPLDEPSEAGFCRAYDFTRAFAGFDPEVRPTVGRLTRGTALALPFPDQTFDAVTSIGMLEHIPQLAERRKAVREALRVLKQHGIMLLLAAPNRYFPFDFHYGFLPLVHWLPPMLKGRYIARFRPDLPRDPAFSTGITRAELRSHAPEEFTLTDIAPAWAALGSRSPQPIGLKQAILAASHRPLAFLLSWLNLAHGHLYVIRRRTN